MIAIEDFKDIKYEKEENGIGTITFNRPERRNALSPITFLELQAAFDHMERDDDVRVVILTGNQDGNAFSSGAYVSPKIASEMTPEIRALLDPTDRSSKNMARKIFDFPKPIVAAVNGLAIGGGITMPLIGADLIYISENAYLGFYFVQNAFMSEFASTYLLPLYVGFQKAKEIIYFGAKIEAQEAFELGLVNKVLPLNELLPYAREQALKLTTPKAPGLSIRLMRKAIHDMFKDQIYKILDVENEGYTRLMQSENVGIAMSARLKKIEPVFKEK
ncbi:MAG: enoyl-CoA hydratase/isomerase family protein [Promethearchaeota archaeon]|jgi:enoyl-CoA hydratase/carnithine racemase